MKKEIYKYGSKKLYRNDDVNNTLYHRTYSSFSKKNKKDVIYRTMLVQARR